MPVKCVFKNCESSEIKTPNLKFARFVQPRTNYARAEKWVDLVGRSDFKIANIKKFTVICEKHFILGTDLNWRRNKCLQPFPSSVDVDEIRKEQDVDMNDIEKDLRVTKELNVPPRTYMKEKSEVEDPIKITVYHGIRKDEDPNAINFNGKNICLAQCSSVEISMKYEKMPRAHLR